MRDQKLEQEVALESEKIMMNEGMIILNYKQRILPVGYQLSQFQLEFDDDQEEMEEMLVEDDDSDEDNNGELYTQNLKERNMRSSNLKQSPQKQKEEQTELDHEELTLASSDEENKMLEDSKGYHHFMSQIRNKKINGFLYKHLTMKEKNYCDKLRHLQPKVYKTFKESKYDKENEIDY